MNVLDDQNNISNKPAEPQIVGIDIRKMNDFGIGTYIRHLIQGLSEYDMPNQIKFHLIINKHISNRSFSLSKKRFQTVHLNRSRRSPLQGHLPSSLNLNLFHAPHYLAPDNGSTPMILTVHDCIHLHPPTIPQAFSNMTSLSQSMFIRAKRFYHQQLASGKFKRAVKSASAIIAVSNYSATHLVELTNIDRRKISVVYNCVDKIFLKDRSDADKRQFCRLFNLPYKEYVLYCGNDLYHKNLLTLLLAWKHLQESNSSPALVLAGPPRKEMISRYTEMLGIQNSVFLTDRVPAHQMPLLYRSALCLVNPSLAEGFGLPVIEAMVSGIPVVCSNLEVFREVTGGHASFFNPKKPEDICEVLLHSLHKQKDMSSMLNLASAFARKYSMNAFVSGHKHVYSRVLGGL